MLVTNPGRYVGRGALDAAPASTFTPASLSPSVWIEPAQSTMFQSNVGSGTGATANGDNVGYIADLSGNGFHLTSAADDATRPTLQGVGVKPYLQFTTASTQLLLRLASTGMYAAGAASVFITHRGVPTAGGGNIVGELDTGSANSRYQIVVYNGATPANQGSFLRTSGNTVLVTSSVNVYVTAFSSSVDTVNGVVDSGSSLTGYKDGLAGTPQNYTRSGSLTLNKFQINPNGNTTSRIYGVVCVNRVLTTQEISDLTTYMAALK